MRNQRLKSRNLKSKHWINWTNEAENAITRGWENWIPINSQRNRLKVWTLTK